MKAVLIFIQIISKQSFNPTTSSYTFR